MSSIDRLLMITLHT